MLLGNSLREINALFWRERSEELKKKPRYCVPTSSWKSSWGVNVCVLTRSGSKLVSSPWETWWQRGDLFKLCQKKYLQRNNWVISFCVLVKKNKSEQTDWLLCYIGKVLELGPHHLGWTELKSWPSAALVLILLLWTSSIPVKQVGLDVPHPGS